MVSALSLFFSDDAHFITQSSPHSASFREFYVPSITHNMASMHIMPSWVTDRMGGSRGGRGGRGGGRHHQCQGKIALTSIGKKVDKTHPPRQTKNKPSMPNIVHNVASMHVAPELAVHCHGRQQRPWPMLPMVMCFCGVCLSHCRTKTVVLHSWLYKSRTNHKTSNKK